MRRDRSAMRWGGLSLLLVVGCGSSPPPAPTPPTEPPPQAAPAVDPVPNDIDDGMEVRGDGLLGTLDEDLIYRTMQPRLRQFGSCLNTHRKLGYVGGTITLKYRIKKDGTVRRLGFESDLGSWEIERCVVEIAKEIHFPRPSGGEAEFEYPAAFRPKQRFRVWDGDRISADVRRHRRELKECPGRPETYALTFFIGAGGKATSVGFSSPEPYGNRVAEFAGCAVEKARQWSFTDPLGQVTKATYLFE